MSVNRKNTDINPVNREGLGFALTSANQNEYPIVYDDDVWSIVKENTELEKMMKGVIGGNVKGTYTEGNVFEAIATACNDATDTIKDLDSEVYGDDENIRVSVKQVDGKLTKVTVNNGLVGQASDPSEYNTIYGAKAAAKDVLGNEGDTSNIKTVYGAFSAIDEVKDCISHITRISNSDIDNLFC